MASNQETARIIRVFVSSPSDVAEERAVLDDVVHSINRTDGQNCGYRLELFKWEENVTPRIGPNPQEVVDQQTPPYDVYLGIMSTRFGTAMIEYGSGTEKEFMDALESWKTAANRWIMFYFNGHPKVSRRSADVEQYLKVCRFREQIEKQGIVSTYTGVRGSKDGFYEKVTEHLRNIGLEMTVPVNIRSLDRPSPLPNSDSNEHPAEGMWQGELHFAKTLVSRVRSELDSVFHNGRLSAKSYQAPFFLRTDEQEIGFLTTTISKIYRDSLTDQTWPSVFRDDGPDVWKPSDELRGTPYWWLVDAVDGVRDVMREIPNFSTTLALIKNDGEAVVAVTYLPITQELFYATEAGGAYLNVDADRLHVSSRQIDEGIAFLEFPTPWHSPIFNDDCQKVAEILRRFRRVRGMSQASYGLAYVAKGAFEAYVDFSHTSYLHNAAAGSLIVRESGGSVHNFGTEARPRFVACNTPRTMSVLKQILETGEDKLLS